MLSFWKNVLSNVCLGLFGADAIFANAKAWDLVLWKCPRRSTTLRSRSMIWFNFLYFHWKVNTFKTPEMCLYLDSEVWAGWFTIILRDLFIILSRFLAESWSVKMSQAFHDPSINFHHIWERLTCLKCVFISTRTFEADVSIIFVGSFPYFWFLTKINS